MTNKLKPTQMVGGAAALIVGFLHTRADENVKLVGLWLQEFSFVHFTTREIYLFYLASNQKTALLYRKLARRLCLCLAHVPQ